MSKTSEAKVGRKASVILLPISITDESFVNVYTPEISSDEGRRHSGHIEQSRRLVDEIVNKIFDDRTGRVDVSSSECSSPKAKESVYSFDRRLKYWKNVLETRSKLAKKITNDTGKTPGDVLFNRQTTIDERDKQTVKRLLDYAERMHPLALAKRKTLKLREYHNFETDCHVHELAETLPRSEREGGVIVEVSGLPQVAKKEIVGTHRSQICTKKSRWLDSKELGRVIEEKREDLERVIEYYPDIDNLQIIGESLTHTDALKHNADIQLLTEESIRQISSDTTIEEPICEKKVEEEPPPQSEYSVKVNENVFQLMPKRSARTIEVEVRFDCEPFEKVVKRVLHLENLGKKVLSFEWVPRSYYDKTLLLEARDTEFVFDNRAFRLLSGESRDVIVRFQPRRANVIMQKWMLKIEPQFFCRKLDAIVVRLNGKCKPPPEYVGKINAIHMDVIEKSNNKMMRKLTTGLGSLTPLIKPIENYCPYKRTFEERELFEYYNIGYRCDRYHDLELLKEMYKRLKKPREPAWDFKLETLQALILRQGSADARALLFAEMMGVIGEMRGKPVDIDEKIVHNPERDRARMVYVRGIIMTSVDEWEELMYSIEKSFLKTKLKEFNDHLLAEELNVEAATATTGSESAGTLTEEELIQILTKDVRRSKAFRDTLYIQTYTHVCNTVEDIVSVIESTEVI